MATPQHTPYGRGFESSLLYFQHANDYWNKKTGLVATGLVTMCLNAFYDIWMENASYRGPYTGPELTDSCENSLERTPSCYEEKIFEEHSLRIIAEHNASDVDHPLFLFHAFHLLHTPLQVPLYYYDLIEREVLGEGGRRFDSENRRLIMAMTRYMDDTVRNLTEAFKAKGMWENTLAARQIRLSNALTLYVLIYIYCFFWLVESMASTSLNFFRWSLPRTTAAPSMNQVLRTTILYGVGNTPTLRVACVRRPSFLEATCLSSVVDRRTAG